MGDSTRAEECKAALQNVVRNYFERNEAVRRAVVENRGDDMKALWEMVLQIPVERMEAEMISRWSILSFVLSNIQFPDPPIPQTEFPMFLEGYFRKCCPDLVDFAASLAEQNEGRERDFMYENFLQFGRPQGMDTKEELSVLRRQLTEMEGQMRSSARRQSVIPDIVPVVKEKSISYSENVLADLVEQLRTALLHVTERLTRESIVNDHLRTTLGALQESWLTMREEEVKLRQKCAVLEERSTTLTFQRQTLVNEVTHHSNDTRDARLQVDKLAAEVRRSRGGFVREGEAAAAAAVEDNSSCPSCKKYLEEIRRLRIPDDHAPIHPATSDEAISAMQMYVHTLEQQADLMRSTLHCLSLTGSFPVVPTQLIDFRAVKDVNNNHPDPSDSPKSFFTKKEVSVQTTLAHAGVDDLKLTIENSILRERLVRATAALSEHSRTAKDMI
eukprot:PhF_6_TR22218/c0_g1_i1/m.31374